MSQGAKWMELQRGNVPALGCETVLQLPAPRQPLNTAFNIVLNLNVILRYLDLGIILKGQPVSPLRGPPHSRGMNENGKCCNW